MRSNTLLVVLGVLIAFGIGGCLGYHANESKHKLVRHTDTVFVKYPIVKEVYSKPYNFYIPVEKRIYSIDTIFQKNALLEQSIILRDTIDSTGIVSRLAEFKGLQLIPEIRKTTIKGAPLFMLFGGGHIQSTDKSVVDFGPNVQVLFKGNTSFLYSYDLFSKRHSIGITRRIK